jgi:acetyltransferase-like isoleucine patch superfamily enzyme
MSRGRDSFRRVRPLLRGLSRVLRVFPAGARRAFLTAFRNTPGLVGTGLRYAAVHSLARRCGDNVKVGPYVLLSYLEHCELGSNISINEFCSIGCLGGLVIEDDVAIAHGTTILTTEHDFFQADVPTRDAPTIRKPTRVGAGVWLGAGVKVLAGVTIGHDAVVGAGSVVTRDVPPYAVAAGVPARVLKHRPGAPGGAA